MEIRGGLKEQIDGGGVEPGFDIANQLKIGPEGRLAVKNRAW